MQCNICGGNQFADMNNRRGVRCVQCNSLERTRLMWLYIERYRALRPDLKVLHLAPEKGVHDKISAVVPPEHYHPSDLFPELYTFSGTMRRIDLCDLDSAPSGYYDLIVHSHVLEHVACNIAYTLYHLHRMLKDDGKHICVIPFLPGKYDECFQDIATEERVRRFGQGDHVRRFGVEDVDSHLGKLLSFDQDFDAEAEFGPGILNQYNVPPAAWKGLTPHTVLCLGKRQMRLLAA